MVLKDDDYLINLTVQVAVQKKNAAKVIALGVQRKNPKQSELDKVASAVADIMYGELSKHHKLIDHGPFSATRFTSVMDYLTAGIGDTKPKPTK